MNVREHLVWIVAAVALGCALDPKTVGQGTDSEDGSGDASGSGDSGESASAGPTETASSDDGTCVDETCVWEPCAEQACGASCEVCPPWDTDCASPGGPRFCSPEGTCELPGDIDAPCGEQTLQPGFEQGLTEHGGCTDMLTYAYDPTDTIALHLEVEGPVAMAEDAGETIVVEYAANDPALVLELTIGTDLTAWTCKDAISVDPVITQRWSPSDEPGGSDVGTVSIAVTPGDEDGIGAAATVTFTDVAWRRDDVPDGEPSAPVVMELLVLEDVHVGWLPG